MQLKDAKLFRQQCYIDGQWVDALNRGTIPVTNPATGETLGTVPRLSPVAGLLTGIVPRFNASTHAPSM